MESHAETAIGELKAGDYSFPLQSVDVTGQLEALLWSATVTQTFCNDRDTRMEAVYVFPLPPRAAVHGFRLKIGERLIIGEIQERGRARQAYRNAVQAGHRAALMEEERSDIFTTTVGNIAPGETVEVSFELSGPLSCFGNVARLSFPLVVGEVYVPGEAFGGEQVGDGTALDTDVVPDASRLSPPRLAHGAANPVRLTLSFAVEPAGLRLAGVESTCHFARTRQRQDGGFEVSLLPGVERMDSAFVLEVRFPEDTLQTTLLLDKKRRAFALTVVPPASARTPARPRDVVLLLDRSGSMEGWKMVAARRATANIVESLTQEDRFAIVTFASRTFHFCRSFRLLSAGTFEKMRAAEFLSRVEAEGGTEMQRAMQDGLAYFQGPDDGERERNVLLITDGEVGDDDRLVDTSRGDLRISTVGIGPAAREGLLTRIAQNSGGVFSLIPHQASLDRDLAELHRRWGHPVWENLRLNVSDEVKRSPQFWDVWRDMPTTFFGRLPKKWNREGIQVEGELARGGSHAVDLSFTAVFTPLVYRAWARSRLLDLEDLCAVGDARAQEMVQLSVQAKVLCRHTAFVAVDASEKVDIETTLNTVVQPVEPLRQEQQSPSVFADLGADVFVGGEDLFSLETEGDPFGGSQDFAPLDFFEDVAFAAPESSAGLFDDEDMLDFTPPDDLFGIPDPRPKLEPWEIPDGDTRVILHRIRLKLEADDFSRLALASPQGYSLQLKGVLTRILELEKELGDLLRHGRSTDAGARILRSVLSTLINYRDALALFPEPADLPLLQERRNDVLDLLDKYEKAH
jgi:Ca-activated chloride channel family protein